MKKSSNSFLRWLPLILLVVMIGLFFYFKLYRYLSFAELSQHRQVLLAWTQTHYLWAVLIFIGLYVTATALSVPGATVLTLTAGFLFGTLQGSIYVVIAATLGATLIFLIVRTSIGQTLASKGVSWVKRLEAGFQHNAFNYLLVLRFIPLFPFWVINIVAGILNVKLRDYFFATLIGIIPGSVVYVAVGNGLGSLFEQGKTPNFSIIFSAEIFLPLIGLAILSIVPVFYKKLKAKHHA